MFYTNVYQRGNLIHYRGYNDDGKRVQKKIEYKPYLFVQGKKGPGEFRTLIGKKPIDKMTFGSIADAREFTEKYKGVDGFEIHGLDRWAYTFINDMYPGEVKFDLDLIRTAYLDIETMADDAFGSDFVEKAKSKITAITVSDGKKYDVFCLTEFDASKLALEGEEIDVHVFDREDRMLQAFVRHFREMDPDVVTGWNVEGFDIPYMYNRIEQILGKEEADKLSPLGITKRREFYDKMGRLQKTVDLYGLAVLDYMQLYLKFTYSRQEQYNLGYISRVELDDDKVDYKSLGYTGLHDLWVRNPQLYMEYNLHDVRLVVKLDEKMGFINQALSIAYDAKVNFEDSVTSVLLWDVIIHNYLMSKNVVVPPLKPGNKTKAIAGGYVKDPKTGKYRWLLSFDLDSLYPHLIMMYNISPEMFLGIDPYVDPDTVLDDEKWEQWFHEAKTGNFAIAGNGAKFSRDIQGFLPYLMEAYYENRKTFKKKMLASEKEVERVKHLIEKEGESAELKAELKKHKGDVVRFKNLQLAKKVTLNSAYGATSNQWFRYYDDRLAEAITLSGQVAIRWAATKLNAYLNKVLGNKNQKDYVLASDTDSVYIWMDDLVTKVFGHEVDIHASEEEKLKVVAFLDKVSQEKLEPFINEFYDELAERVNAFQQKMRMKRESITEVGIWTGAKHYIMSIWNNEGVAYNPPKFKVTGISSVRSSTPTICRGAIESAAKLIIADKQDELYKFVDEFRAEFDSAPVIDIARNSSIKDINKYKLGDKSVPSHVNGSLAYNQMIRDKGLQKQYPFIRDGDRVKFVKLKKPNPAQNIWIAFPNATLPSELNLEPYIDRDEQCSVGFLSEVKAIADAAGLEIERRATLMDFFS